jgi:hypothetical protein
LLPRPCRKIMVWVWGAVGGIVWEGGKRGVMAWVCEM